MSKKIAFISTNFEKIPPKKKLKNHTQQSYIKKPMKPCKVCLKNISHLLHSFSAINKYCRNCEFYPSKDSKYYKNSKEYEPNENEKRSNNFNM